MSSNVGFTKRPRLRRPDQRPLAPAAGRNSAGGNIPAGCRGAGLTNPYTYKSSDEHSELPRSQRRDVGSGCRGSQILHRDRHPIRTIIGRLHIQRVGDGVNAEAFEVECGIDGREHSDGHSSGQRGQDWPLLLY